MSQTSRKEGPLQSKLDGLRGVRRVDQEHFCTTQMLPPAIGPTYLPMRATCGHCEGRRVSEDLSPLLGQCQRHFWEAEVVADAEPNLQGGRTRGSILGGALTTEQAGHFATPDIGQCRNRHGAKWAFFFSGGGVILVSPPWGLPVQSSPLVSHSPPPVTPLARSHSRPSQKAPLP